MWKQLFFELFLTWIMISFVSLPLLALVEGYSGSFRPRKRS